MTMDGPSKTLAYADAGTRGAVRTRWAWGVLWVAATVVGVGPMLHAFMVAYVVTEYHEWLATPSMRLYVWAAAGGAIGAWVWVAVRSVLRQDDPRSVWARLRMRLVPLALAAGLVPLAMVSWTHRTWIVDEIERRRAAARAQMERVGAALAAHRDAHLYMGRTGVRTPDRYGPYPPHLATVVSAGRLGADELVFFGGAAAAVPTGITEADWRRIEAGVDATSDVIYLGGDVDHDQAVEMRGSDLILAYCRRPVFYHGYLVRGVSWSRWVRERDFAAAFARHNATREAMFLPRHTVGVQPAVVVPAPLPPVDAARERAREQYYASGRRGEARLALHAAVMNYAADHGGDCPPHFAALLTGRYVTSRELCDPTGPTVPWAGSVAGLAESDWPKIAAEVESHCDFVLACADVVVAPGAAVPDSFRQYGVVFYGKRGHPQERRVVYSWERNFSLPTTTPAVWRMHWMVSNEGRVEMGLPALVPDTAHRNPQGLRTLGAVVSGTPGWEREVAVRSAAAIAGRYVGALREYDGAPHHVVELLHEGRISPRHLKVPGSATPALELGDRRLPAWRVEMPRPHRSLEETDGWEQKYSDFQLLTGRNTSEILRQGAPTVPVVYSTYDFGGTGRAVGFSDGTARFVAKGEMPDGVPSVWTGRWGG